MTPEKQAELNRYIQGIANILYQETDTTRVKTLLAIEETIREQTLKYITPQIGFFLSKTSQTLNQEESETSEVSSVNYQLRKNKPSD